MKIIRRLRVLKTAKMNKQSWIIIKLDLEIKLKYSSTARKCRVLKTTLKVIQFACFTLKIQRTRNLKW